MLHLRIISPPDTTPAVERLLTGADAVTHVVVLPGSARDPVGDLVLCDVVREGASDLIARLRDLGIERDGSIMLERVDTALSAAATRAEKRVPGLGVDAVVWEEVEHTTAAESEISGAFLAFMIVATVIAGIGVLLDQPILIVGAMVVGPEFGPLAALCVGVVRRRPWLVRRAGTALLVGFAVGMLVTVATTWLLDALGLVNRSMLLDDRPLTSFIWQPDALSWVVGFLAGIAGMLSLTSAKSGTLVGVLISVTTVPAAANAAVALAYGVTNEAAGSALQLLVNVAAIVTAGVLTLLVQRLTGRRRGAVRGRAGR
ncbi:hypothetical protein Asp14428_67840 [Actinoplanes sp. NBRC 14428]|uniref:Putative hydrophobic protein (TIGR00271 family) n=1 Tax=Pseudosporangium ferrugineum TaxID=439699 RepID=A0A2T0RQF7_9ACTN|nr:DUF389 domain-containing protein [Pseudosporangium ferrugineum]PRY23323.1 putative hydrophobic protein (TIGR00271 family) [Pseudosporangium ferrugineum]BCJ55309.1 hypothetical protein Asp14428_67840 [Actinoplanes sp. NBRC 14428]